MAFDLKALDGATLGSQHLAGKVVVLNFWATWCGPCKEEMPSLARLQSQFDPGQVRVVTVTADIHPKGIKQFLDHLGIKLPVLFDEDQELSRPLHGARTPDHRADDQDGQALGRAVGPRAWDSKNRSRFSDTSSTGSHESPDWTPRHWDGRALCRLGDGRRKLSLFFTPNSRRRIIIASHIRPIRRCAPGPVRSTPLSPFMPVFHLASSLLWSLYCDGTAPRHKRASFPL